MGGATMAKEEYVENEIKSGIQQTVADNELREPLGWQIVVQTMNRLTENLHSDSLNRETKNEISLLRQEMRENAIKTDGKIDALRLEVKTDIDKFRESVEGKFNRLESNIDKVASRVDKLTYWAVGIIVTIILAVGYIGHK